MKKIISVSILFILLVSGSLHSQQAIKNMYLLANLNTHVTPYSAVWGYKAPDGREYAIYGCYDGTAFVDITDVNNIHQVGFVPSTNPGSSGNSWREFKTYSHYAYIVSEVGNSGVQIVDLQYLPDSIHYVKKFVPSGHSSTHSISQEGPYLYLNGCNSGFGSGVTVLDLTSNPETPIKRGGYNARYIHDCRVVNDTIYAANIYDGTVTIISAVNKSSLTNITSFVNLPNSGPHNTALTTNGKYLLVTDEIASPPPNLLKIWDVDDFGNITYVTNWQPTGITSSTIHNVEIYGNYALIGHYTAGVRFVDITNPASPTEVAWYDTYPANNSGGYSGCWGAYMFPTGKIAASDRSTGLYVLKTPFNISLAIEGYYNSSSNKMAKKDTVRAYLRNSSSPYSVVDSSKAVIDSVTLTGEFRFNNALNGNYYIALKHRSFIQTWSKSGGEQYDPMTLESYNFTTSDAQAFGNNMTSLDASPVRFGVYNGDSNQDGIVDLSDITLIFNDAEIFQSGYLPTDLTGDDYVDLSDLTIAFNNAQAFVQVTTP